MAKDGTVTQVTLEDMERVRKNVAWLQSNMVDDLAIENEIAGLRGMIEDVIRYLADRDGISQSEISFR